MTRSLPRRPRRRALAALALALPAAPGLAQEGAPPAPPTAPGVERAAVAVPPSPFGFSGNLRADVEFAVGLRDLGPLVHAVLDSRTAKRVEELWGADARDGLAELRAGLDQGLAFVGRDLFLALGYGSAREVERLMKLQAGYDRVQARTMASILGGGSTEAPDLGELVLDELYARDGELLDELHALQLPRLLLGSEVGPDLGAMLLEQARGLEAQFPPFVHVSEVAVPRAGTFRTWRLVAREAMEPGMLADLERELGPELAGDVERVLSTKTVEVAFGLVDGVFIVALGPDHEHLDFAQFPDQALPAAHELATIAERVPAGRLLAFSYVARPLAQAFQARGQMTVLAQMFSGMVGAWSGMAGADFGDSETLIEELGERLDHQLAVDPETSAGVVWIEDGLRGAGLGGAPMPGIDGRHPLRLAALAPDDAVLTMASASTEEGVRDSLELLELCGHLAVDLIGGFAGMGDDADLVELDATIDVLEGPLTDAWEVLSTDLVSSLGREAAMFLDLNGDLPLLPDVPAVLQEFGRGPRMVLLEEVRDADALADAWTKLAPSLHEVAARIDELDPDHEVRLPVLRSAGGDALRSHFFALPFEHGDFLPAATVSTRALALGTSRRWNEALLARAAEPVSASHLPRGFHFALRFDAVHTCAEGWLELVRSNLGPVFGEDVEGALEFQREHPELQKLLEITAGLGGLSFDRWQEGRWRSAWHLEVHDLE